MTTQALGLGEEKRTTVRWEHVMWINSKVQVEIKKMGKRKKRKAIRDKANHISFNEPENILRFLPMSFFHVTALSSASIYKTQ